MAYDLQEQEQIDELKAFWNRYGNFILTVLTVVLLGIAGYRGWGWYEARQAASASAVYDELRVAAAAKDPAKVGQAAGTLFEDYGRTAYARMGALAAARVHAEAGDLKAAKAPLQWAIDKGGDEFAHMARIRLAGILLDEKAYDEGLKLLPMESAGEYAGAYADRRGDLLLAQGKSDEARAAWRQALEKLPERSPLRPLVEVKLDALGGAGA
ncbi:MAG: YfgM family protein [Gammaproteobacteria bacterium]|jgi:predicted negative regulator of RcsB-dependent stress response